MTPGIVVGDQFGVNTSFLAVFIITISIVWLTLVFFSFRKDGVKKTIRYFVPMMVAALFIEATGVANGRFHYQGYLLYFSVVGGTVPLIILLGWSSNLYLFLGLSKQVIKKIYLKNNVLQIIFIAFGASIFGVCLDILEDPVAHHNGWWVWTENSQGAILFDVPYSNFVDWFLIIFFMSLATLIIDRSPYSETRKLILSFTSLPLVFGAILITHSLILGGIVTTSAL